MYIGPKNTREVPRSQHETSDQNVKSTVEDTPVTSQNLIKQVFNRKKLKADQTAAPATQPADQAKRAEQSQQDLNAYGAALDAYGMCNSRGFRPDVTIGTLKVHALGAMKKLHSQGMISKDDLRHFEKYQASHQNFTSYKNSDFLPLDAKKSSLCQAAIGQAWIDERLCDDEHGHCLVTNAERGFHIHTGTRDMWWK
jgi:hypothetical protein